MKNTRTGALIGLIGFGFAALVLSAGHARADDHGDDHSKDVKVVNTPNVNVVNTPAVTISGTPSVSLAGSSTVNIGNTPTVNVSSLPAVQVSGTPNVHVVDTSEQVFANAIASLQVGFVLTETNDVYTVPAGKRLVIEDVSYHCLFATFNSLAMEINVPGGISGTVFLPLGPVVSSSFAANSQLNIRCKAGSSVRFLASRADSSIVDSVFFGITGRLEDSP